MADSEKVAERQSPSTGTHPVRGAVKPEGTPNLRRTVLGAVSGNFLEQYDFGLYGSMSALVLGALFFSDAGGTAALFAGLSTFAIGFFARPLGGVIAGHFGDIYGRKGVLITTLVAAGIVTALIGVLPVYAAIGIWAPILLISLRFLQGLAVGGEMVGAWLMVSETAPTKRRGFYTSMVPASAAFGFILANVVILICLAVPNAEFRSWGWRIPFLFSIVLVAIGLWIRRRVEETPAFRKLVEQAESTSGTEPAKVNSAALRHASMGERLRHSPFLVAVRANPRPLLAMTGLCLGFNAAQYIPITFLVGYLGLHHQAMYVGVTGVAIAELVFAASIIVGGALSDRWGRLPLIAAGSFGVMATAFPLFALVDTRHVGLVWLAMGLCCAVSGLLYSAMCSMTVEVFATGQRYSGGSIAYQIGGAVGGGATPLLATALFAATGSTWPISLVMIAAALLCLVSSRFLKETAQQELV
ncbi:MFS transporter [Amycolatopsis jejuensis]|uniref:MFS transporter n=1 Tax=Amycolatopsis jejuensis TaxID=330084 RepID=UPI00052496DC|nr:MFS transporter [Amycolatopsis jejuensis]